MRRLAAALLMLTLLAGCSGKGERYYQRAEQFLIQGQFRLAAEEYRRVVQEEPNSPLADDALYKLAYLYREELSALPQALQTYQALAARYPASPYADDALLWALYLQGEKLHDPLAVRRTYGQICQRFGARKDICARGALQLAKALLEAGQLAQADREAQELLNLYPGERRQAAAALLLRARVAEKRPHKPDTSLKLYEQVITNYPDTLSAAEAKRTIGWLYYGERGKQLAAEKLAKQRAAREIGGVPNFPADNAAPRQRPFYALRSLLSQRGVHVTREELLAVSGAAFDFVYNPQRPDATRLWLSRNALSVVAEQYGFAVNTWSAPDAASSFASLAQSIGQGTPVMVPQADNGRWLIVAGYRPAEDQVLVLGLSGSRTTLGRDRFLRLWARGTQGHTACVVGPYYQFSLGQRLQAPTPATLLKVTARRGAAALNETGSGDDAHGLHAYDVLAEQVASLSGKAEAPAIGRLREWSQESLPSLLSDRQAAISYLSAALGAVSGGDRDEVSEALTAYSEVVRIGRDLRTALLSLTRPAQGAEPPPEASWPETAELVRQMKEAEQHAAARLAALAQ